jgi:acyl phosphate:glycerol-3-phosphate acyltransferase
MPILAYSSIVITAYLLGSIPTGYLVARQRGIDIRTVGSGNIGATNAFRVLGRTAGIVVLLADALKGYAACVWLVDLVLRLTGLPLAGSESFRIVAGGCAVLGHSFTCWLQFKGGKGVATSAGVFLALVPLACGIALGSWVIIFALGRYVSLASLAAATTLPIAVWLTPNSLAVRLVTTAVGLTVIWRHRSNIQRLLQGTEHRFGRKHAAQEGAK